MMIKSMKMKFAKICEKIIIFRKFKETYFYRLGSTGIWKYFILLHYRCIDKYFFCKNGRPKKFNTHTCKKFWNFKSSLEKKVDPKEFLKWGINNDDRIGENEN